MIYDNSITGEEKISEYPEGNWVDIAKNSHFDHVFIGAFEAEKNIRRDDKGHFVDSPTATNVKKETAEELAEKTRVVDEKDKEKVPEGTKSSDKTQVYDQDDVKNISDSLIKPKKDGVIRSDQKSPIIPQAVIVSLDNEEEVKEISKLKIAVIASVIIVLCVLGYFLFKKNDL